MNFPSQCSTMGNWKKEKRFFNKVLFRPIHCLYRSDFIFLQIFSAKSVLLLHGKGIKNFKLVDNNSIRA